MHISNVSLSLRMLQLLHLDVSKLDRVLHLPHRLMLSRLVVRREKRGQAEAVPACAGGLYVHAQARGSMLHVQQQQVGHTTALDVGADSHNRRGRTQQARRGQAGAAMWML
jgi:hypothetical protein